MTQEVPVFGQAIGGEKITVANSAIGITASLLAQYASNGTTKVDPRVALITSEGTAGTNDIRWRCDGTSPDASTGHYIKAGEHFIVRGLGNITKLRMIRVGGTSGTVHVTLFE